MDQHPGPLSGNDVSFTPASAKSYIQAMPYTCETQEEMDAHLEFIVGKIVIAATAKHWLLLISWDSALQCWLELRYPIPQSTRAKLVSLYYELCLLPGIEPRIIRSWADMVSRLISNKPGMRRKLEASDLQLPWIPLWRVLKKELFPKHRLADPNRNVVNILLYVAEQCKRYFGGADVIHEMLGEFLPMVTIDRILSIIPVLTSFLPPTHPHLYVPVLLKLWEAFNSSIIDDRLLDFFGDLAEEHVAGTDGLAGPEGGAKLKDVGIWTLAEWNFILGKGINSMSVPIGASGHSTATASQADVMSDRQGLRIKKNISRYHSLAKLIVYSLAPDGPVRTEGVEGGISPTGYSAGSKALDSLEKLMTSTETFFHPSNTGRWSLGLTNFLHRLATEFAKRTKEEESKECKIPVGRRLTPSMSKAFITILRTPALLSMFAKDAICMSYAQGALRVMSVLEPSLIMPDLLERAYSGLEVVNETHRTTAVLSTLSGVALPLVSEQVWIGGQKHIIPLLELSLPGIDVNDPVKTICTTMFIVAVVQHIKIGDLTSYPVPISGDLPGVHEVPMENEEPKYPAGNENVPVLSREEERTIARDSTASFADWVTSLLHRVLALYENLPEEGGRKNVTGGKQEEGALKSIKSMMDVVCLHLSDHLFDLVLHLLFDYATTNAKSNAVRAFGHLIACLARAHPEKVLAKFLPYCISQVEEELRHGASSTRTTSTHEAVPSDTTLHWNISILRGCLGYGGSVLVKRKEEIIALLNLLIDKTKSERGYSTTGHLLSRVLLTVASTYPLNSRFVNSDVWESEEFDAQHNLYWGRMFLQEDVDIEWHVPSPEEINFVFELLDRVVKPCMSKLWALLQNISQWQPSDRNDFCRYLTMVKSFWSGLPTIYREQNKEVVNPCLISEYEHTDLLVTPLIVGAGFILEDPKDPRYVTITQARQAYSQMLVDASVGLRQNAKEDHTDAVTMVVRAIDVSMLEYGLSRTAFDSLRKNYKQARDVNRLWARQKENSRLVMVKRAQLYHTSRIYINSLYRRRSAIDDQLIHELVEQSLSPYVRVRRQAQSVFQTVVGYYVRSTRIALPVLLGALAKGSDPDRMKGALYVLRNKGISAYALADAVYQGQYVMALLECQHEEKPSIQKLVAEVAKDCCTSMVEEAVSTDSYTIATTEVDKALQSLRSAFSNKLVDPELMSHALGRIQARGTMRQQSFDWMVSSIVALAKRPETHWRYLEMCLRFLATTIRRDAAPDAMASQLFIENTISPQPGIRSKSQLAVQKVTVCAKIRTYARSAEELWREEWWSPLRTDIPISDERAYLAWEKKVPPTEIPFVDKILTGFLAWSQTTKAYRSPSDEDFIWEADSMPGLDVIRGVISSDSYFEKLLSLWGQESTKNHTSLEARSHNYVFIKSLAKMYPTEVLDRLLPRVEPLLTDANKFQQRAGAEVLAGLLRGSKHWPPSKWSLLWSWASARMDAVLSQIKPEMLLLWEGVFSYVLHAYDPRRVQPVVDWILNLPLEFQGDSAFAMNKMICLSGVLIGNLSGRLGSLSSKQFNLLMENANTPYFEVRAQMANSLYFLTKQWHPQYKSVQALLEACEHQEDPLLLREVPYGDRFGQALTTLSGLRDQRLPPPRVSQSEYDKIGLTLLQFLWAAAHGSHATKIFPYVVQMMPEILRMTELNDSADLQTFSTGVLHILSAITPPVELVDIVIGNFVEAVHSSSSWKIRRHTLPALVIFFYRNLTSISQESINKIMEVLRECLRDENVEVREMASQMLSGIVRCSQRQSIIPLKNQFMETVQGVKLPGRRDPGYANALRNLHSGILGLCALIESFPYSVERWMPPLTEVLAPHATDPLPISTTIRKCASEFKKTHQDTWHKDQIAFNEDQLQSLSTMLVGTSYYA